MSKNNIRLSKRENHKMPNAQVRGIVNKANKEKKIEGNVKKESAPDTSSLLNFLLTDKKSINLFNWMIRIVIGYTSSTYFFVPETVQAAVGYWATYLTILTIIDFFKKEK